MKDYKIALVSGMEWQGRGRSDIINAYGIGAFKNIFPTTYHCITAHDCYIPDTKDVIIAVIPKNPEYYNRINNLYEFDCPTDPAIIIHQEGNFNDFMFLPLETQVEYIKMLESADAIFAHSLSAMRGFEILTKGKVPVYHAPTVYPYEEIKQLRIPYEERKNILFCHGNLTWRHNGILMLKVLEQVHHLFDEIWWSGSEWFSGYHQSKYFTEYIPEDADQWFINAEVESERQMLSSIPNLKLIKSMNWNKYIHTIRQCKIGFTLTEEVGAMSFWLNCATLGIPCVMPPDNVCDGIRHGDIMVETAVPIHSGKYASFIEWLLEYDEHYQDIFKDQDRKCKLHSFDILKIYYSKIFGEIIEGKKNEL